MLPMVSSDSDREGPRWQNESTRMASATDLGREFGLGPNVLGTYGMTTILIILVVLFLLGGGGYGYRRWRG